jgi:protein SDA1
MKLFYYDTGSEENSDNSDGDEESDDDEVEEMQDNGGLQKRKFESEDREDLEEDMTDVSRKKQKTVGGVTEAGSTEQSLRNLKKIVAAKAEYKLESEILSRDGDGILSNEDFERIRELQVIRYA